MTWYTVGLWPGAGIGLDMCTIEAFSPEEAIGLAALSGCGMVISDEEYEKMVREEMEDRNISWAEAEDIVCEICTWLDPPRGYVLLENATCCEATPMEIFCAKHDFHIVYSGDISYPDAFIFDKEGNALCYCLDCYKTAIERLNRCPFCGSDKIVQINAALPSAQEDLNHFDEDDEYSFGGLDSRCDYNKRKRK